MVLLTVGISLLPHLAPDARADEVTISGNNLRDGWDGAETTGSLTPSALTGGTFGQLFAANVDGQVYAQPIVAGGTLIVATENDWVYGLNTHTGAVLWSTSLGTPWPASAGNCTDLAPSVGVTGTPVYDAATGTVYLVSEEVPAGHTPRQPAFFLNALDVTTGKQRAGWPVPVRGAPANDPTVPFNPFTALQRPGLLLIGGSVYMAFGSHCDFVPYEGYVAGVNTTTRQLTMWSDESGFTDTQAGIWQSGGGLMSDGAGRIFFASGNGISPPYGPGSKPPSQLAESVVRLGVQNDGSLAAKDFFSPRNAPALDANDRDLGSGGPVGLPFGTSAFPHLMIQAGKLDGLFVLNRDRLGGRGQGPGGADAVVSVAGQNLPGEWGHPAAFATTSTLTAANVASSRDYVYYVGQNDALRYFRAGLGGANGTTPVLADVAQSTGTFGYTSGSPVVTSDGTKTASAVVWVVNSSDQHGTTGQLQAFPAVPPASCSAAKPCAIAPLWSSLPFSGAGKFTTAATDGGRVYIATRGVASDGSNCLAVPAGDYCGQVLGYGSPAAAPLSGAAPASFGDVPVGSASAAQSVTVTNTQAASDVTVSAVATSGPGFAVAGPYQYTPAGTSTPVPATLPQLLHPGDALTVEGVTFAPVGPGGAAGTLELSTDSANFPVVGVPLSGTGTQNGFYAASGSVGFGQVPAGTSAVQQLTVTNGESAPQTLTATMPGAPFGVSGLPDPSQQIQPGQSVLLTVTYAPAATGQDAGTLTLTGNDGTNSTVTSIALVGTGAADVVPTLTGTASLDFGSVPMGRQVTKTITIVNSGNLPAVITASTHLPLPYGTPNPVASGLPITPGSQYQVHVPVTFTPTSPGPVTADYQVTWTDVAGTHTLSVPLTGTGVRPPSGIAVPPPGGGWQFNGSARMVGQSLNLTGLAAGHAGSAVYSVPEPGSALKATFTARIGGGTGADGLTFAMLDAAQTGDSALGGSGGELGFGGLAGVAVTLDTHVDGPGYPSKSFVGIATGAQNGLLTFAKTANVPGLRQGSHKVGVTVSSGTVSVSVDGKAVLSAAVPVPSSVRLAFTGANGAMTDNHVVSGASITAGGHAVPAPGGGWSYNQAAAVAGTDTILNPAAASVAGSVVYPAPVPTAGLHVTFDAQLSGGSTVEGLTFALLNPAKTSATTVGGPGGMLGLGTAAGVPGAGVALQTGGHTSPLGFAGTTIGVGSIGLRYQQVARGIGSLVTGTHPVTVTVSRNGGAYVIAVYLDGVRVLAQKETGLPSTVRLAFTAGSAAAPDQHLIRAVAIAASG